MSSRPTLSTFLPIALDPRRSVPLHRQIYDELRAAILSGRLAPGVRLPSTRSLADDLGVSRNTVMYASEQLFAEGYIHGRVGSGTFVANALPEQMLEIGRDDSSGTPRRRGRREFSKRGRQLASMTVMPRRGPSPGPAFRSGLPAVEHFPLAVWRRLLDRRLRAATRDVFAYGESLGYRPLREAIAAHLTAARGARCEPDQVLVTSGAQQALDLVARVVLDPGDQVWVEDPGYVAARAALMAAGARLVPVPVDGEGIDVAAGAKRAPRARLVYVTPSHHHPLGMTMSLARRLALLQWANRAGAWIVEDDFASEYRYAGRPLAALQGLDTEGRVLYVGTFSKVLFPSLRLGYLVVPRDTVEAFAAARAIADRHSPTLEQGVTADFITEGHFARHLRRMRMLYAERCELLTRALANDTDGLLTPNPVDAGVLMIGWLAEGMDDRTAFQAGYARGVDSAPLSAYCLRSRPGHGLLLGFTGVDEAQIRAGVRTLTEALHGLDTRTPRATTARGTRATARRRPL